MVDNHSQYHTGAARRSVRPRVGVNQLGSADLAARIRVRNSTVKRQLGSEHREIAGRRGKNKPHVNFNYPDI